MTTTRGPYTIGAAAQASGLTTYTIRMWERRYGAVVPPRTAGRSRVYSHEDVARLARLRRLTAAGHAIRHIATLPDAELDRLGEDLRAPPDGEAVERFLLALAAYDVATAEQILAKAALLHAPRAFVAEVAVPILDAIGTRWAAGELRVYHEHAASALLRATLAMLIRGQRHGPRAPIAIAGTLVGESHQLGAQLAALHAATAGWRVIVLDDHAPAAELAGAATQAGARAILVSFVGEHQRALQAALDELLALVPRGVAVLVGGRSAGAYALGRRARLVALDQLGDTLHDLARARPIDSR